MSKVYIGLALADSMFPADCSVRRSVASLSLVLKLLAPAEPDDPCQEVVNCCNPSHKASLDALRDRYGIDLGATIPAAPPKVKLESGDMLLVLGIQGLPRLTDRHEYTPEEVAKATFTFGVWSVD